MLVLCNFKAPTQLAVARDAALTYARPQNAACCLAGNPIDILPNLMLMLKLFIKLHKNNSEKQQFFYLAQH